MEQVSDSTNPLEPCSYLQTSITLRRLPPLRIAPLPFLKDSLQMVMARMIPGLFKGLTTSLKLR